MGMKIEEKGRSFQRYMKEKLVIMSGLHDSSVPVSTHMGEAPDPQSAFNETDKEEVVRRDRETGTDGYQGTKGPDAWSCTGRAEKCIVLQQECEQEGPTVLRTIEVEQRKRQQACSVWTEAVLRGLSSWRCGEEFMMVNASLFCSPFLPQEAHASCRLPSSFHAPDTSSPCAGTSDASNSFK